MIITASMKGINNENNNNTIQTTTIEMEMN